MFQQNTSPVQVSTGTEKAIHKATFSGIALGMWQLTIAPSHPTSADGVTPTTHRRLNFFFS